MKKLFLEKDDEEFYEITDSESEFILSCSKKNPWELVTLERLQLSFLPAKVSRIKPVDGQLKHGIPYLIEHPDGKVYRCFRDENKIFFAWNDVTGKIPQGTFQEIKAKGLHLYQEDLLYDQENLEKEEKKLLN